MGAVAKQTPHLPPQTEVIIISQYKDKNPILISHDVFLVLEELLHIINKFSEELA